MPLALQHQIRPLRSPLRWAGSKRLLVPALLPHLSEMPGTYYEPFAGAANLFFALAPARACISDLNPELINFYRVLRDSTDALVLRLAALRASRTEYYRLRSLRPRTEIGRAIRFAYLNRLCWNGLYRVNRLGDFNVPIGDRLPKTLWREPDLRAAAVALTEARLEVADFQQALATAGPGDAVFLDPPYPRGAAPASEAFNRYRPEAWKNEDYDRLVDEAGRLDRLGVVVIVTLSGRRDLLSRFSCRFKKVVHRTRALISCDGTSRRSVLEAVVTNQV